MRVGTMTASTTLTMRIMFVVTFATLWQSFTGMTASTTTTTTTSLFASAFRSMTMSTMGYSFGKKKTFDASEIFAKQAAAPATNSHTLRDFQCRLTMEIGRIPGSAMPKEWASSGAKLVLPNILVQFQNVTALSCLDNNNINSNKRNNNAAAVGKNNGNHNENNDGEQILGPGPHFQIHPIQEPTFVSSKGLETVPICKTDGAFKILQDSKWHDSCKPFRFFMDFPKGAVRNDVTLPAERVYFTTFLFDYDEKALQASRDCLQEEKMQLQQLEYEYYNGQHSGNDNNSNDNNNNNIFSAIQGIQSKMSLTEKIMWAREKVDRHTLQLPTSKAIQVGNVYFDTHKGRPGYLLVKRSGGFFNMREEYHIIGTFTIDDITVGRDLPPLQQKRDNNGSLFDEPNKELLP